MLISLFREFCGLVDECQEIIAVGDEAAGGYFPCEGEHEIHIDHAAAFAAEPEAEGAYQGGEAGVIGGFAFGLWQRACEKEGQSGRAGWTLKRQLAEMEAPPAFADDLREYHYALRYEEKPPDADREGRLVEKIKGWD